MIALQPLYIVNMFIGLTLAICIAFVAWGRDRDLTIWSIAFVLYPIAFGIFGLRDFTPPAFSIIFGNGTLSLMLAYFTDGLCRLNGIKLSRLLIWLPTPFVILGFALLLDDLDGRVYFGSVLMAYHGVIVAYIVTRSVIVTLGRGRWIIFSAFMISTLMFLVRGVLMALGLESGTHFLTPGISQTIYFSISIMCLIMFAIGLLVTYKEHAEASMRLLAQHDPLTHLANRRVLQERLQHAFGTSSREGKLGAMLMLDLDCYKEINDAHGHALGDQLLVEVAYRLKDCVTDVDTVVRLGGDEFVLLIEGLDKDPALARSKALSIAHRVQEMLARPYTLDSGDSEDSSSVIHELTVSIGVALFLGATLSREALFRQADAAMYKAKQSGKNCTRVHDAEVCLAHD